MAETCRKTKSRAKSKSLIPKYLFDKVLTDVLDDRGLLKLTDEQKKSLEYFINDKDTFVSLPTGHGKSLIFQLAIPVIKHLQSQSTATDQNNFARRFPKNPLLIVIAPLQALISDQISSCEKLGLKSVKLDDIDITDDMNVMEVRDYELIFTSPETLAGHLIAIRHLDERIGGVVVDESHCVVNW